MKKKYNSIDEINAAQRKMHQTCNSFEKEMLGYVSNPLSLFFNKNSSNSTKKSATPNSTSSNNILDTALEYAPMALPLLKSIVIPKIVGGKLKKTLFKGVLGITWKIALINIAIWGAKKGIQQIKSKRASNKL